jgi:hypothetical protein
MMSDWNTGPAERDGEPRRTDPWLTMKSTGIPSTMTTAIIQKEMTDVEKQPLLERVRNPRFTRGEVETPRPHISLFGTHARKGVVTWTIPLVSLITTSSSDLSCPLTQFTSGTAMSALIG